MIKDELLRLLFREYKGESPDSMTILPKSGSDRIYCRMKKGDFSLLGVWNPNRKENDAFTGFAGTFKRAGLRVPEILSYLPEEMVYLIEDLGDTDLCSWVKTKRESQDGTRDIIDRYKSILDELLRFQFDAQSNLDYNLCYPRKKFDRNSMIWDLNYFKYMFLRLSGTGFNEQLLENDFNRLAERAVSYWSEGFLYRDFQSRNILIFNGLTWFIDFQGGRKGAPYYDAASLLLDPYTELESPMHDELAEYYSKGLSKRINTGETDFLKAYRIFGLVRLLQALGAYGLRGLYERKPNFASGIPPAVRQLNRLFNYSDLREDFPELLRITETLSEKWEGGENLFLKKLSIIVESFSFNKGVPDTFLSEGGFVFDCRNLTTPEMKESYGSLSGRDKEVRSLLENIREIDTFIESALQVVINSITLKDGQVTGPGRVCFGCDGGRILSVYCAEQMAEKLAGKYAGIIVFHNELQ